YLAAKNLRDHHYSDTAPHEEDVLLRPGSSASPSTSEFGAFSDLPFEAGIEPRDPAPLPSPALPRSNVEPIPAPPLPNVEPIPVSQLLDLKLSNLRERSSAISKIIEELRKAIVGLDEVRRIEDNPERLKVSTQIQQKIENLRKLKAEIGREIAARAESGIEIDKLNSELKDKVKRVKEEIKKIVSDEETRRLAELKEIEAERLRLLKSIERYSCKYKDEALEMARLVLADYKRYDAEDMEPDFFNPERMYYIFSKQVFEILTSCLPIESEFRSISSRTKEFSHEVAGLLRERYIDKRKEGLSVSSAGKLKDKIEEKSKSLEMFIERKKPMIEDITKRLGRLGFSFVSSNCKYANVNDEAKTSLLVLLEKEANKAVREIRCRCTDISKRLPSSYKHAEYIRKLGYFEELAVKEIEDFLKLIVQEIERTDNSKSELVRLIISQDEQPKERIAEHKFSVGEVFSKLGISGHALNPWLMAVKKFLNSEGVQRLIVCSMDEKGMRLKMEIFSNASRLLGIGLGNFLGDGRKLPEEFSDSDEFLRSTMNYLAGLMVIRFFFSSIESGKEPEIIRETFRIFFRVTDEECSMQDQKAGLQVLDDRSNWSTSPSSDSNLDCHITDTFHFLKQNKKFQNL
ncbi:MAG: hypothetical protein LBK29_03215, partial [Oscillospiraceae bacterium]|nr:hypothetical protein [Oscillospiraceae bacterium]